MRLALWSPRREAWWAELASQLARDAKVDLMAGAESPRTPSADLSLYHLADNPAHGLVYRALLTEPGLVVLEDWNLHTLVHAETAGRGDVDAYRREARRTQGPTGAFVAQQVLRGRGGLLPALVPLNECVFEAGLAFVVRAEDVATRVRERAGERPVALLALGECAPRDAADTLLALAREVTPRLPAARQALESARAERATPLGCAVAEILPFARELGLWELPPETRAPLAALFDCGSEGSGARPPGRSPRRTASSEVP